MTKNIILGLLLFTLSAASLSAQKDSTDDVIKIDTSLVSVPVVVSDRQGRYVAGLDINDFTLFHDGEKRKIDFFAAEEEPINVALLLDTSPSTASVIDQIKRAAVDFVQLLEKDDKATIVTFDTRIRSLTGLTSNRIELEMAIRNANIGVEIGTVMRDAVEQTIEGPFGKTRGRKAIILLTDGMDFGSKTGSERLLYELGESDVLIYTVYYKTDLRSLGNRRGSSRGNGGRRGSGGGMGGRPGGGMPGGGRGGRRGGNRSGRMAEMQKVARKYLKQMSEITAGRYHDKKIKDLSGTFGAIVNELRKQYRLGFYMPENAKAGSVHNLKVNVNREKVSIRHRSTYRSKGTSDK